jgi:protein-S-isoprenylcysteine O-methyltransferase Ste14
MLPLYNNERSIRRDKRRKHLLQLLFTIVQMLIIFITAVMHYIKQIIINKYSSYRIILIIITFITFVLWFISRLQLGDNFSIRANTNGSSLVTHGVYKKLSNPIYYFSTISIFAFILLIDKPIYLFGLFILIPIQFIRIKQESKVLKKQYGQVYDNYIHHVWF